MLKIWGRNTSSNVQKVMWAIGELEAAARAHRRRRAVRQEQGAVLSGDESRTGWCRRWRRRTASPLWESNSIVRYLAAKHATGTLEPADLAGARRAAQLDGLAALGHGPGHHAGVLGPDPHAAGQARPDAIAAGKIKTIAAMKMLDAPARQDRSIVAGDAFSYGDIPVGIMTYRFVQLIPERPPMPTSTAGTRRSHRGRRSRIRSRRCR